MFPDSAEIAEVKFSVPTESQKRGNCSIKSLNILAQFIAQQYVKQPVVYEKDENGKLSCETKTGFKKYKEFLVDISKDLLQSITASLETKENKSKLDEFVLKKTKEVFDIYDNHQLKKTSSQLSRDAELRMQNISQQAGLNFYNSESDDTSLFSFGSSVDSYSSDYSSDYDSDHNAGSLNFFRENKRQKLGSEIKANLTPKPTTATPEAFGQYAEISRGK